MVMLDIIRGVHEDRVYPEPVGTYLLLSVARQLRLLSPNFGFSFLTIDSGSSSSLSSLTLLQALFLAPPRRSPLVSDSLAPTLLEALFPGEILPLLLSPTLSGLLTDFAFVDKLFSQIFVTIWIDIG
ncbi:hypothetical protein CRG98_009305 [Punica granatum]|uniref:Uncharacterized protein n=1 Tax=Punica granatum TaxID=22663 RepID=A0A2I0KPT7_PUNGR|nr:hypothetical protein CRG98_009305 [Punica granatum]